VATLTINSSPTTTASYSFSHSSSKSNSHSNNDDDNDGNNDGHNHEIIKIHNFLQQIEQSLLLSCHRNNHTIISICYQRYTIVLNIYDRYVDFPSHHYQNHHEHLNTTINSTATTSNDNNGGNVNDNDINDSNNDDIYGSINSVIDNYRNGDTDIDEADLIMYKNKRCHVYFIGYPQDCRRYVVVVDIL
jgi:hypothetical protein